LRVDVYPTDDVREASHMTAEATSPTAESVHTEATEWFAEHWDENRTLGDWWDLLA